MSSDLRCARCGKPAISDAHIRHSYGSVIGHAFVPPASTETAPAPIESGNELVLTDFGGTEWCVRKGWLWYRNVCTQHKWRNTIGNDPCGICIDTGRAEIISRLFAAAVERV